MESSNRLLISWCKEIGIEIYPGLTIYGGETTSASYERSIIANESIANGSVVVRIPPSAILSFQSVRHIQNGRSGALHTAIRDYSRRLEEDPPNDPLLPLSLALLGELENASDSKWSGYLQSLPRKEPSLALFWPDREDPWYDLTGSSERLAREFVNGSQLDRYLKSDVIRSRKAVIWEFFLEYISPALGAPVGQAWAKFRRAYSLASSRAFWVDTYHRLAMVPIADVFNHAEQNHVHLETDWEVCRTCGALEACPHDEEEEQLNKRGTALHSYDMVCNSDIIGDGTEVFNTYDAAGISNVDLLVRYGFIIEGNEADIVVFGVEELGAGRVCPNVEGISFDDSELIYVDVDPRVDAEGKVSHWIWMTLAVQILSGDGGRMDIWQEEDWDTQEILAQDMRRLARAQIKWESYVKDGEEGDWGSKDRALKSCRKEDQQDHYQTTTLSERQLLIQIGTKIAMICSNRIGTMWDGSGTEEGFLQFLPVEGYVLGEREILETCQHNWRSFVEGVACAA